MSGAFEGEALASTLPWIEVDTDLPRHKKSILLGHILTDDRAWTYMVQLWLWMAEHSPTGVVSGAYAAQIIERAAGWKGVPTHFVRAAIMAGFLEEDKDSFRVHNLENRLAAHVAKRQRDAERQRRRYALVSRKFGPLEDTSQEPHAENVVRFDVAPSEVAGNSNTNTNQENNSSAGQLVLTGAEVVPEKVDQLRRLWNELRAPSQPEWRLGATKRRATAKTRLREHPDLAVWREAIVRIAQSKFCRGEVPPLHGHTKPFLVDPDRLLEPDFIVRVLEGKYDDRNGSTTQQPPKSKTELDELFGSDEWGRAIP